MQAPLFPEEPDGPTASDHLGARHFVRRGEVCFLTYTILVVLVFAFPALLVPSAFAQLLEETPIRIIDPERRDGFASALAAGDINGDGFDDLVVGNPQRDLDVDPFSQNVGKVYVFLGGPFRFNTLLEITNPLPQVNSRFGRSLDVGYWNDDRFADVLVGAPFHAQPGGHEGFAALFASGGPGGVTLVSIFTPTERIWDPDFQERFGFSVAFVKVPFGPFGSQRIAIGAPLGDVVWPGEPPPLLFRNVGHVYVYRPTLDLEGVISPLDPSRGGLMAQYNTCATNTAFAFWGDNFGFQIAGGDIVPGGDYELFVASPQFVAPPDCVEFPGHVEMFQAPFTPPPIFTELMRGTDNEMLSAHSFLVGGPTLVVDNFLGSAAQVPAVCTVVSAGAAPSRVKVYRGADTPPLELTTPDQLARSLASGDVNADGVAELLVGGAGNVFVYKGPLDATSTNPPPPTQTLPDPLGDRDTGGSLTSGDFNGDGCADVAVGNVPQKLVYVFLGRPTLKIGRDNQTVSICWRCGSTNFVLEATFDLTSPNWMTISTPVVILNNENCVMLDVNVSDRTRFFRLRKL